MPPLEVFLSHSSQDHAEAARLSQLLHEHGVPTFFAPENIRGAQQWQDEILQALLRCDWFLVLLSPAALNSMWVKRETAFALQDHRYENRIVPLLGPLAWLSIFQTVDFRSDFESGCRELLRIWGIGLKAAGSA